MEAIQFNHSDIAITLVKAGASLSHQDVNNENAFHYAARNGSSKLIKDLVKISEISSEYLKSLVCILDIKQRFPEDLATKSLAREVLMNYRQLGIS